MPTNKNFLDEINKLSFIYSDSKDKTPQLLTAAFGPLGAPLAEGAWSLFSGKNNDFVLRPFHTFTTEQQQEIITKYQIPDEETVIFAADFLQIVLITDKRIIWDDEDNEEEYYSAKWEDIIKISYNNKCFWIKFDSSEQVSIPSEWFWGGNDVVANKQCQIARILTKAASLYNEKSNEERNIENAILEAETMEEASVLLDKYFPKEKDEQKHLLFKEILWFKNLLDELFKDSNSLTEIERLNLLEQELNNRQEINRAKSLLNRLKLTPFYSDGIGEYYLVLLYTVDLSNQTRNTIWQVYKETSSLDFWNNFSKKFNDNFAQLPYKERKLIMPLEELPGNLPTSFCVFDIQNMPKISFPLGHPQLNELYIAHPLVPNRYLPLKSYQLNLLEEQVREFSEIMQALGATETHVKLLNNSLQDTRSEKQIHGGVKGRYMEHNLNIEGESRRKRIQIDELKHQFEREQVFRPTKAPYIPDNLVWYPHFESWQQLARQRFNGALYYKDSLSTINNQLINSNEQKNLCVEYENIFVGVGAQGQFSIEEAITNNTQVTIELECKFAPLENLPAIQHSKNESVHDN